MKQKEKTKITKEEYKKVYERDNGCCIFCGSPFSLECHHFISRGRMGLGCERNLVMLCNKHHYMIHNATSKELKIKLEEGIEEYLKSKYKDWKKEDCIWKKI